MKAENCMTATPVEPIVLRSSRVTCTLYCGDCLDLLPIEADAVVTDPPYGMGIAQNPFRQKHETKDWDDTKPDDIVRQLADTKTPCIIWGGNYFDLPPQQRFLVWDKVQPEDFTSAMVEMAWTNIGGPAKLFRRHVVSYTKYHPTTKPTELMMWCLGFIPDAKIVLDPFMGSGTTGVACVREGRNFIGVEKDEKYFKIAVERIRRELAQERLF